MIPITSERYFHWSRTLGQQFSFLFFFSSTLTVSFNCLLVSTIHIIGLPRWQNGKESACQCGRHRFDPWMGKSPCRRKWQPTQVFLPRESCGQRNLVGHKDKGMTKLLSTHMHSCNCSFENVFFFLWLFLKFPFIFSFEQLIMMFLGVFSFIYFIWDSLSFLCLCWCLLSVLENSETLSLYIFLSIPFLLF